VSAPERSAACECRTPLTFRGTEVEHLIPKSLKGEALEEALTMHGLPDDYDLEAIPNLAPSCRGCNSDKSKRIPPNVPAIVLLLEKSKELQPAIEKRAAGLASKKNVDYALGIILATVEAAEVDTDARARLQDAMDVLAPVLAEMGASAPEEEVALHPAMEKILGEWKLVAALSDNVAVVTDGKGAGTTTHTSGPIPRRVRVSRYR
jgi:hypothetical protein